MKRLIICLALFLLLVGMSQAQNIGLSFFYIPDNDRPQEAVSFGVTFEMIWICKHVSMGADWGVFKTKKQEANIIGWSIRFHIKDKLTIPIGFDFINDKLYVGLGARF